MNRLYTAKEIAKVLKCSPRTVYDLGKAGKIERLKVGKLVRFYMPNERSKDEQEKIIHSLGDGALGTRAET